MFPAMLFPLLLLQSLRSGVDAHPPTFTDTDPLTGRSVECNRCPPGTYMKARCTSRHQSDCAPCPAGSFTELWNYIPKCLRCGICGQNQVVKKECSVDSDCQCECKQGFYYKARFDMCLRHGECPPGHGVLSRGTAEKDTVCHACSNGTFSSSSSALDNCTEHSSCGAAHLLLKGSTWHDSLCTSCAARESKEGADYLREILPAFFAHQQIHVRRLRRIVHKLPSADGKSQGGTSGLDLASLQRRVETWVGSATVEQLRQLPLVLSKVGASGAGDRLQSKLRRIDSSLKELCDLGNEVEVSLLN
ncbi:uncharacterized protein V6R79_025497 [Siganus canaliculatus]